VPYEQAIASPNQSHVMPIHSELPPPKTWEDFEELCADLFAAEWNDLHLVRHGREGQKQNGVDIYGKLPTGGLGGVQCKNKRHWPPKSLKAKDIDDEVESALTFVPRLKTLIIATTAPDDTKMQNRARTITERHKRRRLFSVSVLGWGELCRRIKSHRTVLQKHFSFAASKSESTSPILGPLYAFNGQLELSGPELSIACREMARELRTHPGSQISIRLREADKLETKLAASPVPSAKTLDKREVRLKNVHKLDELRNCERHLSAGVTLILGEPSISALIVRNPDRPQDAPICVSGFVEEYLRPNRGVISQSWTKYVIFPEDRSDIFHGWIYLTPEEDAQYCARQRELLAKYNNLSLLKYFWELPENIRFRKGVPAAVNAILRAIEDGMSLEQLRRDDLMDIVSWNISYD
jgi:hypothetical protein